jgi:exoribonuclease R
LKRFLNGDRQTDAMGKGLDTVAAHIDDAARRSARAEEERLRTLVATSLLDRIGAVFPGRVVGHKPFGALVQLPGIVATMPDGTVALGAALDVRIMAVDAELGRVEVAPAATST